MTEARQSLEDLVGTLGESSQFVSQGSLPPLLPGLNVQGAGLIGLPVSAADAKRLIVQAEQAPYGRGEKTILDTNVRRVWQLDPAQFALENREWDGHVAAIVDAVRQDFGIAQKVKPELYKLLVYEKGSFFAFHRDTEKTSRMFGTLMVCLPSRHEGGPLIVRHDGRTVTVDFAKQGGEFETQYAAFYADCEHEIKPVTSGYRICLIYNLATAGKKQPRAPQNSAAVAAAAKLLSSLFADAAAGPQKIAVPFRHQYTEAGLDPRQLKGADREPPTYSCGPRSLWDTRSTSPCSRTGNRARSIMTRSTTIPTGGDIPIAGRTTTTKTATTITEGTNSRVPTWARSTTNRSRSTIGAIRRAAPSRSERCVWRKARSSIRATRKTGHAGRRSRRPAATPGCRWSAGIARASSSSGPATARSASLRPRDKKRRCPSWKRGRPAPNVPRPWRRAAPRGGDRWLIGGPGSNAHRAKRPIPAACCTCSNGSTRRTLSSDSSPTFLPKDYDGSEGKRCCGCASDSAGSAWFPRCAGSLPGRSPKIFIPALTARCLVRAVVLRPAAH